MCTLERDWLRRNSAGGDDVPGEMGRVVGLREGVDTQFCLKVDTGDTLTCTLPQFFTQFSGIIRVQSVCVRSTEECVIIVSYV